LLLLLAAPRLSGSAKSIFFLELSGKLLRTAAIYLQGENQLKMLDTKHSLVLTNILVLLLLSACASASPNQGLPPAGWKRVRWDAGNRGDFTGLFYPVGPHAYYTLDIPDNFQLQKGKAETDRILGPGGREMIDLQYWGCPEFRARSVADWERIMPKRPVVRPGNNSDAIVAHSFDQLNQKACWTDPKKRAEQVAERRKRFFEQWQKIRIETKTVETTAPKQSVESSEAKSQQVGDMQFWRVDLNYSAPMQHRECIMVCKDGITFYFEPGELTEKIVASLRRN